MTFSSRQFNGEGTRPEGIRNRMFGSEGVLETEYGGQVLDPRQALLSRR